MQVTRHHSCRVSPFGHPRINARLTTPRGISQPPTSFIGSQCQGIHHAPLHTYNTTNQNRKTRNHTTTNHTPHTRQNTHTAGNPPQRRSPVRLDARNHYPQIKHHTPPPSGATTTPAPTKEQHNPPRFPTRDEEKAGLLPQSPIACPAAPPPGRHTVDPYPGNEKNLLRTQPRTTTARDPSRPTLPQRKRLTWCSLERR
jgi:hypothetical protein